MSQAEIQKTRKPRAPKNDLHEARPLLQAIFLGIVLATALVAAAVMANPDPSNAANANGKPAVGIPVKTGTSGK